MKVLQKYSQTITSSAIFVGLLKMGEGKKIWHWIVLAVLSLIWGTSYILMKKGLESFSLYQVGALRVIITLIFLSPIAVHSLPKLNKENFRSVIIIGFLGSGIPAFLFPLAQSRIDSSLAGMLNTLNPVFTLVTGILFYRRKVIRSQIAGVTLGLIGAIGLLYSGSFTFNFYGLFVVLATIMNGFSSNEVSRVKGLNGLQLTALSFLVFSPFAIIILLNSDFHAAMETENWLRNLGCIAILSIIGSALANALFYKLIRETSPLFGAISAYFIPIVATLWGLADNEHLTSSMFVSVTIILVGVYIINRQEILKKIRKQDK
ncbi:MAG: DMT family transporter [Bacteroidales bacterium]|nr:DMT family transporter [Bacteroidales bacterium]